MKEFLSKIHPIDDSILEEYLAHWSEYRIPQKTIMTAPGEIERYMYFVLEGIQKSYHLHEDKFYIIAFSYPPSFTGIPESFLTQSPSRYYLETVTDSVFLRISYERHQNFMEKHRSIETLFRKATEHMLVGLLERHFELMAFDIETRFKAFARRSPHLINMLSQKEMAAYLRIDPTNLSKLFNSVKI